MKCKTLCFEVYDLCTRWTSPVSRAGISEAFPGTTRRRYLWGLFEVAFSSPTQTLQPAPRNLHFSKHPQMVLTLTKT